MRSGRVVGVGKGRRGSIPETRRVGACGLLGRLFGVRVGKVAMGPVWD